MKKPDLSRHVPPGFDYRPELRLLGWGTAVATGYSFTYFWNLREAWRDLFRWSYGVREPIEGAVMPDFDAVLGFSLMGFLVLALWSASFLITHYLYHHQGSRSIYLMRRLPNRWERHRRCLTLPLLAVAYSLLLAFLIMLLYFVIYLAVTPAKNLTPDQWQKLWSVKL